MNTVILLQIIGIVFLLVVALGAYVKVIGYVQDLWYERDRRKRLARDSNLDLWP